MNNTKLAVSHLVEHILAAANILKSKSSTSEHKEYILGMLFLKRCSDLFIERQSVVIQEQLSNKKNLEEATLISENKAWYKEQFYVPIESRWRYLLNKIKSDIGNHLNIALSALERENSTLKDAVKHIDFNRKIGSRTISDSHLRQLIEHFDKVQLRNEDLEHPDIIGVVNEFLIRDFAYDSGKKGGEFYTPRSIVRLLAHLVKPEQHHKVYDPCCGSGGILIAAKEYVDEQGGDGSKVDCYGQEMNGSTLSLAKINLLLNGVRHANISHGDTLMRPTHTHNGQLIKFDRIISHPPFSTSFGHKDELFELLFPKRFQYGQLPKSSQYTDLLFLQHMIATCSENGKIATIVPQGALFRGGKEQKIREGIVQDDLVECIISLPSALFYGTSIPAAILILTKNKPEEKKGNILFIDASYDYSANRYRNILRADDIGKICNAYERFSDIEDYARMVSVNEIVSNSSNLNVKNYIDNSPTLKRIKELNKYHHTFERYKLISNENKLGLAKKIKLAKEQSDSYNTIFISRIPTKKEVLLRLDGNSSQHKTTNYYEISLDDKLIINEYAKLFFESELGQLVLSHLPQGASVPKLSEKDLESLEIPVPSQSEQKKIINLARKLDAASSHLLALRNDLTSKPALLEQVKESTDSIIYQLSNITTEAFVKHLLKLNETKHIEFKQFFFLKHDQVFQENANVKADENEQSKVIKNIASFLNSEGGTLLLGVEDDARVIGIERELKKLKIMKIEQYFKRIERKVVNQLGAKTSKLLSFDYVEIDEKTVAVIKCDKSPYPVFQNKKDFVIRRTAESEALYGQEMLDYIRVNFDR
ncbi:N-6 DNA methylase [Vibrio parahaemolyticus]|nr:N-6 DNA methylase [Vibrio parahaemolyticus]ELA9275642.1 N-6 DNA methylase [Vibrio parahaemolyticus]ELA9334992.1 N-6 DNA methylase [Vibrio parahaemolyticus]